MLTTRPFSHSLKTRITLATLAVFLASLWSLSFYATRGLHRDIEKVVSEQQLAIAGIIAEQINRELSERLQTLQDIAGALSDHDLRRPQPTQAFFNQRRDLLTLFNSRLFVTDTRGDTVATLPYYAERIGINFADRDYLIGALENGKPTIGRPLIGRTSQHPAIVMAVPILDPQDTISGALAGSITLDKPTFLDHFGLKHHRPNGSLTLISRQHRLTVMSTEDGKVLTPLTPENTATTINRFLDGADGTAIFVDQRGVEVLVAARSIPIADWLVIASLPTAEAFAPIRELHNRMLLATLLLTLIAASLTWWLLRRQLAPLQATADTLDQLSRAAQTPPPLTVARHDEIGQLIAGFNRLLDTLRQRETALKESEAHFRLLTESVSDIVWKLDANLIITYISPADEKLRGFPVETVVGQPVHVLVPPEERPLLLHAFDELAQAAGKGENGTTFVVRQNCLRGPLLWTEILANVERSADGTVIGYHGITRNITERCRMEEQIRRLAFHDTLTGLPNRRLLMDRLQQAIAASRRSHIQGALLFIDLDNFKPLNDRFGHNAGDHLLIEVAARLRGCLREMDSVARFGGDEFVVLISELATENEASRAQAEHIADKIRATLGAPYLLAIAQDNQAPRTVEHHCSASIGITLFDEHRDNPDDLLRWADRAMYRAKESGRNRLVFATQ